MEEEVLFARTLQQIKTLAREQGGVISEEQLVQALETIGFSLDENRRKLIYEYLKNQKIGVEEELAPEDCLTGEEMDYLNQYLEELACLEELSPGEKEAVTLSALAGDSDAKAKLVEAYLPYVTEVARLYAGQGVLLEDLIGEGNAALVMGVEMLDCVEHSGEVQGMLGKMMMDAMEEYIVENTEAKKADWKMAERVNRILEMARELSGDLGRKVTPEELAEEKGIPLKQILDAVRISGNKIEELDMDQERS